MSGRPHANFLWLDEPAFTSADVSITSNTPYITASGTVLDSDMLIYDSTKNIMQIGSGADLNLDASNLNLVAYGNDLTITATHTTNSVFIGDTIGVGGPYDLAFQNTAVGNNITVGRSNNTIIGYNNQTYEYGNQVTLLGSNLTCLYDDCILIGDSLTATGSDQLEIGHWFSGSPAATSINETLSLMYTLDDFNTSVTAKMLVIETNNIVGFRDLPTSNAFEYSKITYERPLGTFGASASSGFKTLPYNNAYNYGSFTASVSSGLITIPEGTYKIDCWGAITANTTTPSRFTSRLFNHTDATSVAIGESIHTDTASSVRVHLSTYITIAASKNFQYQIYSQRSTNNYGYPSSQGVELYGEFHIQKLA